MIMHIQSQHATTAQSAIVLVSHCWQGHCLGTKPVTASTALSLCASANAVCPVPTNATQGEVTGGLKGL